MSIRFRGGERLQRGRGIGGLLRLVKSVFSPIVKSFGRTAIKAVTSKTGKKAIKSIQDQLVTSAINMTGDVIQGNDLGESFQNQVSNLKQTAGNVVKSFAGKNTEGKNESKKKAPKRKEVTYNPKSMSKRDKKIYGDNNKNKDVLS